MSIDLKGRPFVRLKVTTDVVPAGKYEFVIYKWQLHGIQEDMIIKPIGSSEIITPHLTGLLEKAEDFQSGEENTYDSHAWDILDKQHYKLWHEAREKHKKYIADIVEFRRQSLTTSHKARIALLEEQLNQADDEKIRRMRKSQIDSANADYARRLQEINIAIERADIITEPVAYGIIIVEDK